MCDAAWCLAQACVGCALPMRVLQVTTTALLVFGYFLACGPVLPSTVPLGGEEDPEDAGADVASDAGSDAQNGAKPKAKPGGSAKPGGAKSSGSAKPGGSAKPPPSVTPPPTAVAPSASPVDAGAPDAADAAVKCDDSGGKVPDCSGIKTTMSPDCVGGMVARPICNELSKLFKPKVAESLVSCLISKSKTQEICDLETMKNCALDAIKLSCPPPELTKTCEDILGSCTPEPDEADLFTQTTCEQGVAALKAEYGKPFLECAKRECKLERCLGEIAKAK